MLVATPPSRAPWPARAAVRNRGWGSMRMSQRANAQAATVGGLSGRAPFAQAAYHLAVHVLSVCSVNMHGAAPMTTAQRHARVRHAHACARVLERLRVYTASACTTWPRHPQETNVPAKYVRQLSTETYSIPGSANKNSRRRERTLCRPRGPRG